MNLEKTVAIVAIAVFLVSLSISLASSPGFRPLEMYLSELGRDGPGAAWFNYGLVATGLLLAIFFFALFQKLGSTTTPAIGLVLGVLSSASLAAVGLMPAQSGVQHVWASLAFFIFSSMALLVFSMEFFTARARITAGLAILHSAATSVFFAMGSALLQAVVLGLFVLWVFAAAFSLTPAREQPLQRR